MSDPTKEPSVSGCGLSRRRNRRISQEQRDTIRRNSVFPATQNGMQDGDTGFDNTPSNRLNGESIRQLPPPPPGFERAGSMADAEAIKPKTILEQAQDQVIDELVREAAIELGWAASRPDPMAPLTTETSVPAPPPLPTQEPGPTPAEPKPVYPWTFENLDKIDAIVAEGESDVTQEHSKD
jgi:hypothetical protein